MTYIIFESLTYSVYSTFTKINIMKNLIISIAFISLPALLLAQKVEIGVNPAFLKVEPTLHLSRKHSLNFGVGLHYASLYSSGKTAYEYGGAFAPEYMYYFNPSYNGNSGFYMSVFARAKYSITDGLIHIDIDAPDQSVKPADFSHLAFGGGLNIGWHVVYNNGLAWRAYLGGGYNFYNQIGLHNNVNSIFAEWYKYPLGRVVPSVGIAVGYRFGQYRGVQRI